MKTQLLSLLAGTALLATVSVAQAGAPMALSESQMDQVTAGKFTFSADFVSNLNMSDGNFTLTVLNGGPVKFEFGL